MSTELTVTATQENFASEVKEASLPVVVDFWAEWCGPCRMLSPVLDEIAEEKKDTVKVVKLNVDDNRELAAEYSVRSIPMLLFFKGGEVKDQITGVVPKEEITKRLDALV
ncbi:MAG: thioredoxin [Verrucomicrobiota bacterium]